ncbi:MAG: imidazole glycerol phosphate synthase subunit HisF [Cellvibrio sp. 79]|nr:MAG: imidazole glycerol phosphate synthase subunit HisF [Cellvibrio sp. 79]
MLKHRVIPALLLQDRGLVKTRKFKDGKYVGDPLNAIRIFNDKEVDELMVLDIVASKRGQEPDYSIIEQFAGECFMPLCYGGGVRTLDQAARIFDLGVEKISIQSAAISNIKLISDIANRFGSQSVVVSIDVKYNWLKQPRLYQSSNRKLLKQDWLEFSQSAVNAGAGELVINAVDRDGEMCGYDIELITKITRSVSVPVIALGGAGNLGDLKKAVHAGASAVAAGSMFVYQGPHRAVLITYPPYSELENLLEFDNE